MPTETTLPPVGLDNIFRTKSGLVKQRWTWKDKLSLLAMGANRTAIDARLREFRRLFAFRQSKAIVTRPGQGPRAWIALRGHLQWDHIFRHLLADRIPTLPSIWVGTRSFQTSLFLCIDVDADRSPKQLLAEKYDLDRADEDTRAWLLTTVPVPKVRAPFAERCEQVERAFRRMGVNSANPRSLLIQPTPSGGRHYYLFLDNLYFLDQYHDLLRAAGLRHVSGETEFFPSTSLALRLPFGLIPGQPHDPHAWIQFIDDYRNGRIIRYSLGQLYDHLDHHRSYWYQRREAKKTNVQATTTQAPEKPPTSFVGLPNRARQTTKQSGLKQAEADPRVMERYRELIAHGISSPREAEELMALGILLPGTRTVALKHLAAHWIWFQHKSAEEATHILTEWSLSPRHKSKDIAYDLEHGTSKVANHIATMCRWYERNRKRVSEIRSSSNRTFAERELRVLRSSLVSLPPDVRINQAHFLLHFLWFAKQHGQPNNDGSGWAAAPAVRQVIRRWPGCQHMNYLARIKHAIFAGVIKILHFPRKANS